jgi:hypothetical protein
MLTQVSASRVARLGTLGVRGKTTISSPLVQNTYNRNLLYVRVTCGASATRSLGGSAVSQGGETL